MTVLLCCDIEKKNKTEDKLCRNKVLLCRDKAKRQTLTRQSFIMLRQSQKRNFVTTKFYYVATKLKTSQKTKFVTTKFYYIAIKLEDKLCRNKVLLCRDIVLGLTKSDVATPGCHDSSVEKTRKPRKLLFWPIFKPIFTQ